MSQRPFTQVCFFFLIYGLLIDKVIEIRDFLQRFSVKKLNLRLGIFFYFWGIFGSKLKFST